MNPNNSIGSPVRESEIGRELQRLANNVEILEETEKTFYARLEGVINGGELKDENTAKNPENSSKLGQALSGLNGRMNKVTNSLNDLLARIQL